MRLQTLKLENFKRFKELELDFKGENSILAGQNKKGKTTVFDAFTWCLMGKDSMNRSELNFGIKTKINGEIQHHLVHAVEAVVEHQGKNIMFRREFMEKWTRKRGSSSSEFTGHESKYYINEVPKKANEYKKEVDSLIGEYFLLLTNYNYFHEQLDDKQRRKFLIDLFGDVSVIDVVDSNKDFEPLRQLIIDQGDSKTPINNIMKTADGKKRKANEQLKEIPSRIDEANKFIESYQAIDIEAANEEVANYKDEIKETQEAIAKVKASAGDSEIDKQINAAKLELSKAENELNKAKAADRKKYDDEMKAHHNSVRLLENNHNQKVNDVDMLKRQVKTFNDDIKFYNEQLQELRQEFDKVDSEMFDSSSISTVCPTCGQSLDPEKVKETINSETAKFNKAKTEKLNKFNADGKKWTDKVAQKEQSAADLEESIKTKEAEVEAAKKELEDAKNKPLPAYLAPEFEELNANIADIQEKIKKLQETPQEEVDVDSLIAPYNINLEALESRLSEVQELINEYNNFKKAEARINELKHEEEVAAKIFEENQQLYELCEKFIVANMDLLSDKINKNFKLANFKLFETQINGGIRPVCIATGEDGVAWNEAMNTGQKYNIGLDIIETFSNKLGYDLPVFIENAESVTEIQELDLQIIELIHDRRVNELLLFVGDEVNNYLAEEDESEE